MDKMIMKLKKIDKKWYLLGSLFIIFCMMFVLNCLTPLIADDFSFSLVSGPDGTPIRGTTLSEMFTELNYHYYFSNGRILSHTFARFFLMYNKMIFNVLNALVFILLVAIMYLFGKEKKKPIKLFPVFFVFLGLWFFVPHFGQSFLWLDGACNYLWTTTIIIFEILLFVKYYESQDFMRNKLFFIGTGVLGYLAGSCNEATSGAGLLVMLLFIIVYFVKKIKVPLWAYSAFIMHVIGFVIMIKSPGNARRSQAFVTGNTWLAEFAEKLQNCTEVLYDKKWLIIICIVLFILFVFEKKNKNKIIVPVIMFFSAIACNYAFLLAPVKSYSPRAEVGYICLLIIGAAYCLWNIDYSKYMRLQSIIAVSMFFVFSCSFILAFVDIATSFIHQQNRIQYIMDEKEKGNMNIVVPKIPWETTYNPQCGLYDLFEEDDWPNGAIADYYGIETILSNGQYYFDETK